MQKHTCRCVIIVAVLTLSACETDPLTGEAPAASTDAGATRADQRLSIYTVNYPLQYFAQRIGGELVDVSFPAPQGIDPADFMPDIDTVAEYQQADIIFLNGAGYAGWIRRMSLPASTQLDTSTAFVGQLLEVEESVVHTHGPTGEHVHDNLAFDRLEDRPLIFSHPVFQYLDQRYGLGGKSVHWEPDVEPAEDELNALAGLTGGVMLWEAEPLPATEAATRFG